MKKYIFSVLILCSAIHLSGQPVSEADTYRLLLAETSVYLNYSTAAPQTAALIDSARQYASQDEFMLASVFLEEFLQTMDQASPSVSKSSPKETIPFLAEISSGIDFNRQEFELGYSNSDSLLNEEINKPFIAVNAEIPIWKQSRLQTNLRYDKENTSANLRLYNQYSGTKSSFYLDGAFLYDRNSLYPDFSFKEWNSRQTLNWNPDVAWMVRLDNELRYKRYRLPSQSTPNFIRDESLLQIRRPFGEDKLFTAQYRVDYNNSLDFDNNNYFDQNLSLGASMFSVLFSDLTAEAGYQNKVYTYVWDDSTLHNRTQALFWDVKADFKLSGILHWKTDYSGHTKSYRLKTEQDPDYWLHQLNTYLKIEVIDGGSVSAGYRGEYKRHLLSAGLEPAFVEEQNYWGNGFIAGLDYFKFRGTLFSFEASYTFRRYPQAQASEWGSLYNNRNVLNLNLLAQIPLISCINLNLFASYDNDQDLDSDYGNTRSAIFSAELIYRF